MSSCCFWRISFFLFTAFDAFIPTTAVITIIGSSHIGELGSRENILKAKLEILEGLNKEGFVLINNDNDLLNNYYDKEEEEVSWLIYPWQKSGSINNDINVNNRTKSSVLSKKKMSNLKYSSFN